MQNKIKADFLATDFYPDAVELFWVFWRKSEAKVDFLYLATVFGVSESISEHRNNQTH